MLGLWHTFKMANILIHRHYALDFLAPLFHFIVPGHTFYPHPSRLIQIQEVFTNLRLAFDADAQEKLKEAMRDARIEPEYKRVLQNLQDLLQFFIPAVHMRCFLVCSVMPSD